MQRPSAAVISVLEIIAAHRRLKFLFSRQRRAMTEIEISSLSRRVIRRRPLVYKGETKGNYLKLYSQFAFYINGRLWGGGDWKHSSHIYRANRRVSRDTHLPGEPSEINLTVSGTAGTGGLFGSMRAITKRGIGAGAQKLVLKSGGSSNYYNPVAESIILIISPSPHSYQGKERRPISSLLLISASGLLAVRDLTAV